VQRNGSAVLCWGAGQQKKQQGIHAAIADPSEVPPSMERGSDNGHDESDIYSFGNVVSMMMMQNHFDNE